MRVWVIVVVAVVVGGLSGIGIARTEFSGVREYFEPASRKPADEASQLTGQRTGPKIVVDGGPKFEFETIPYNGKAEHTFVVRNAGNANLRLSYAHPSCGSCIQVDAEYRHIDVPPGKEANVVVRYLAHKAAASFSEAAYFRTNDALIGLLKLDIVGTVTQATRIFPNVLPLGSISSSEGAAASATVLGYHGNELELMAHKFSDPVTGEFFEITSEPMSRESVTALDKFATTGKIIHVKLKPGVPLGSINQVVTLHTRSQGEHVLDLSIGCDVVGDIHIIGPSQFDTTREPAVLLLGMSKRGIGKSAMLSLIVKGPYRDDVKFSVNSVDPPEVLRVTLGEGKPIGNGKSVRHELRVEVPKDAPTINRLGSAQGEVGTIIIGSTHPTDKTIRLNVSFTVE